MPSIMVISGAMTAPSSPVAVLNASNEAPSEPKVMDQECPTAGKITALSGSKPMPTMIGATTAIGTPKPPTLCRNELKAHPIMRTCSVLSGEICRSIVDIALSAPLASVMRKKNSAPQMMYSTCAARKNASICAQKRNSTLAAKRITAMTRAANHPAAPAFAPLQ